MKSTGSLEKWTTLTLWGGALAFAGIGVAFLVGPQTMGRFVGVMLEGPTADNDARAVYGGLQLACGVGLAWAAGRPRWHRPALAAQTLLFCGLAGGRFVSLLLVGRPSALALGLHAAELVAIVCSVACLRLGPREVGAGV